MENKEERASRKLVRQRSFETTAEVSKKQQTEVVRPVVVERTLNAIGRPQEKPKKRREMKKISPIRINRPKPLQMANKGADPPEASKLFSVDSFSFKSRPLSPPKAKRFYQSDDSSFYGLSSDVRGNYFVYKKVERLYEWQDTVLRTEAVQQNRNLIYTLPTSAGKTLVAEICLLRCIFKRNLKALFVVPFISIVVEKTEALEQLCKSFKFRVDGYHSNVGIMPPRKSAGIAVCTIERAAGYINCMIQENRINEIGTIVVNNSSTNSTFCDSFL